MEPWGGRIGPRPESSTSGRILVVDDHELNLKLLERVLEIEGHEVRGADSLAAAERALAEEQPTMIVLDVNLPDGNGLELTRKLKSHPGDRVDPDRRLHRRRDGRRRAQGARGRV